MCTEQFVDSLQSWFCSTSYEVSLICHFHGRADQISSRFWKDCQATDSNTTTGDNVPVTACPLSHSRVCTYFLVSTEPICPGGSSIRSAKCGWSRMKYQVCHNSLAEATVGTRNRLRNIAGCFMIFLIKSPSALIFARSRSELPPESRTSPKSLAHDRPFPKKSLKSRRTDGQTDASSHTT